MWVYSIIMFLSAAVFTAIGIAIYKGNTNFIHDYHQTKVTDRTGYGKAFGKAFFVFPTAFLLSGIIALSEKLVILSVGILLAGMCIGVGCIIAVQKKYNHGVF